MKPYLIPTAIAGATAALSMLFLSGLSGVVGDQILGRLLIVQSAMAIVQVGLLPQAWLYLIESTSTTQLVARYRIALTCEMAGAAIGAFVVICAAAVISQRTQLSVLECVVLYLSLCISGMGSCLGWLRAREQWWRLAIWVLGPNLIRVPLVWLARDLQSRGMPVWSLGSGADVAFAYFLLPDLLRLGLIAVPLMASVYGIPQWSQLSRAFPRLSRNWIYEIGSSVVESLDKVVVGLVLGAASMMFYYFGRKLGLVVTIFSEPMFAEQYRRLIGREKGEEGGATMLAVYVRGLILAVALYLLALLAIWMLANETALGDLVLPASVRELFPLFAAVLGIEALLAANRWVRYVVQARGMGGLLLCMRLVNFAVFCVNVVLLGRSSAGVGVVAALAIYWALEMFVVIGLLRWA